jgi:excinuclease ABC subunit C
MLDATWDFETHTVRSEAESVLLEGKLIKEYRPRYKRFLRDDKRFLLVRSIFGGVAAFFGSPDSKRTMAAATSVRTRMPGAAANIEFHAEKIRRAHFGRGSPSERELKSATIRCRCV